MRNYLLIIHWMLTTITISLLTTQGVQIHLALPRSWDIMDGNMMVLFAGQRKRKELQSLNFGEIPKIGMAEN